VPEGTIRFTLNGRFVELPVAHHRLLRDFIREELGLTGTKGACEDGMCGSCTVHLDGLAVKSCLLLAVEADGHEITTIEGMARGDELHPIQQAFIDNFGFQCGYCTPGFIMTAAALIWDHPELEGEREIREALVGNICRCTGYTRIVASYVDAARRMRDLDGKDGSDG
jgi:carbon-monoxide dehydrogenase small subunit